MANQASRVSNVPQLPTWQHWMIAFALAFGGSEACTCSKSQNDAGSIDSPIEARVIAIKTKKLDADAVGGHGFACVIPNVKESTEAELVIDTTPKTRLEIKGTCVSYELSASNDTTRLAYRCKDTSDAPWQVLYLRDGGLAFRSPEEVRGPIDWGKVPDFTAASATLFRAYAEHHPGPEADGLAGEIARGRSVEDMARFVAETADANSWGDTSCQGGATGWRKLFESLPQSEKEDVVLSLEAGLRRKGTKTGAIRKALLLVDIDAAGLQDDLLERARELASTEQDVVDGTLGLLLVRLARQRSAQAGAIACEVLAQPEIAQRDLRDYGLLHHALMAVAAAKTPCPAVLARVENVACDEDSFCDSSSPGKRVRCPASHFEPKIKNALDRPLEEARADLCKPQAELHLPTLVAAALTQGKLSGDIDRRQSRMLYALGPAPRTAKSSAALPNCTDSDAGVACACDTNANIAACKMDPEEHESSARDATARCRFAVDDAKRRIVVTAGPDWHRP